MNKAEYPGDEVEYLYKEVELLSKMDHPNIVRLYAFYDEPQYYCLVTEVCAGGELFDAIISSGHFSETDAQSLIKRLMGCINYCHKQGIVHRDLKPENILLEKGSDYSKMKVIDFGTARAFDQSGKTKIKEKIGTPFYMAPEVLRR